MVTDNTPQGELLSRGEEHALINDAFIHHMPHPGSLFSISRRFYDRLDTEHDITQILRELYRWLGSKPPRIHVIIDDNPPHLSAHSIYINPSELQQPYTLACKLVYGAIRETLRKRLGYEPSINIIETAAIDTGLGAIVVNSLAIRQRPLDLWHHGKKGQAHTPYHLESYTPAAYIQAYSDYCHQTKLDSERVMAQLTPEAQKLMPHYYQAGSHSAIALPKVLQSHRHETHVALAKVVGAGLITAIILLTGLFIYAQQPYQPSKAATIQYQKTQALQSQYRTCLTAAEKRQNSYDQNDIFTERDIQADLAKCDSLKNQYNYEVGIYNQIIEKD